MFTCVRHTCRPYNFHIASPSLKNHFEYEKRNEQSLLVLIMGYLRALNNEIYDPFDLSPCSRASEAVAQNTQLHVCDIDNRVFDFLRDTIICDTIGPIWVYSRI